MAIMFLIFMVCCMVMYTGILMTASTLVLKIWGSTIFGLLGLACGWAYLYINEPGEDKEFRKKMSFHQFKSIYALNQKRWRLDSFHPITKTYYRTHLDSFPERHYVDYHIRFNLIDTIRYLLWKNNTRKQKQEYAQMITDQEFVKSVSEDLAIFTMQNPIFTEVDKIFQGKVG